MKDFTSKLYELVEGLSSNYAQLKASKVAHFSAEDNMRQHYRFAQAVNLAMINFSDRTKRNTALTSAFFGLSDAEAASLGITIETRHKDARSKPPPSVCFLCA